MENMNTTMQQPYKKDFYRISKERLTAYGTLLGEALSMMTKNFPKDNNENKIQTKIVDEIWQKVNEVRNSLYGFRCYEDMEVGGGSFDDWFLYDQPDFTYRMQLDNGKFHEIEFRHTVQDEISRKQKVKEETKSDNDSLVEDPLDATDL